MAKAKIATSSTETVSVASTLERITGALVSIDTRLSKLENTDKVETAEKAKAKVARANAAKPESIPVLTEEHANGKPITYRLAASSFSGSSNSQNAKKINMYNQLAQICFGYDADGSIKRFDSDGDFTTSGDKINEAIFFTFSRLLVKDEIKKESFSMKLGVSGAYADAMDQIVEIKDTGANSSYKVNSPVGEYGILYVSNSVGEPLDGITGSTEQSVGLVFYQAGIVALTSSIFMSSLLSASAEMDSSALTMDNLMTGSQVSASANAIRHRIQNISFNNTTELNSTIYFCRVNHNEFNYSSNPTYLTGSEIIVKNSKPENQPISYITTVGLYSSDNTLMAVGKLSEPLRKDPTIEYTLRARLDY